MAESSTIDRTYNRRSLRLDKNFKLPKAVKRLVALCPNLRREYLFAMKSAENDVNVNKKRRGGEKKDD